MTMISLRKTGDEGFSAISLQKPQENLLIKGRILEADTRDEPEIAAPVGLPAVLELVPHKHADKTLVRSSGAREQETAYRPPLFAVALMLVIPERNDTRLEAMPSSA